MNYESTLLEKAKELIERWAHTPENGYLSGRYGAKNRMREALLLDDEVQRTDQLMALISSLAVDKEYPFDVGVKNIECQGKDGRFTVVTVSGDRIPVCVDLS